MPVTQVALERTSVLVVPARLHKAVVPPKVVVCAVARTCTKLPSTISSFGVVMRRTSGWVHHATVACLIPTFRALVITRIVPRELDVTSSAHAFLGLLSILLELLLVQVVDNVQLLLDLAPFLVDLPICLLALFAAPPIRHVRCRWLNIFFGKLTSSNACACTRSKLW